MILKPTHDLVHIKKILRQSEGSIVIPQSAIARESIGTVVAIGPGETYSNGKIVPLTVNVGDEVIYSKFAGQTFKVDSEEIIALREKDIYAIISCTA